MGSSHGSAFPARELRKLPEGQGDAGEWEQEGRLPPSGMERRL